MSDRPVKILLDSYRKEIVIQAPFHMREICKSLSSRKWDPVAKAWVSPANIGNIEEILLKFNGQADISPFIWSLRDRLSGQSMLFQGVKDRLDIPAEQALYEWSLPKPMLHQVSGTMAVIYRERCLLFDEQGLGKTREAIDAACHRFRTTALKRVLVVCPSSLKYNWRREIEKWAPAEFQSNVVVNGPKKDREELIQLAAENNARWVILNYELLRTKRVTRRDPGADPTSRPNQVDIESVDLVKIKALAQDQMLVCDEAHRIKNLKAQGTRAIQSLEPRYIVLMTGTPISNKPEDVYPLVNMVEPGLLGINLWQFQDHYCKKGGYKKKAIVGYRNLDEMRAKLETVCVRRLKQNVIDLPPKVYELRHVDMEGDQLREYARMRDELVATYLEMPETEFRLVASNAAAQLLRLQQIADGFVSLADRPPQWFHHQPKMAALDEIVEDICGNNQKIVLWSRFRPATEYLENRYAYYGSVRIYGDVDAKDRDAMVDRFTNDPECRVFVGQVHTGGLGLTLTAAQVQVFYDRWWSISVNVQAEDRLHRIGTRGTVNIITLICRNSIDESLVKMLESKKQWSDTITGDDLRLTKRAMMSLLGETDYE